MVKGAAGRGRLALVWGGCALVLLAIGYLSATSGAFDIPLGDIVRTLLRIRPEPDYDLILFEFRLPRLVVGALVGLGLGIAGAVIQGITRNGLADPGILGVNAGAGTAIVAFMFVFQSRLAERQLLGAMAMPLFGLVGGFGAAALVYALARQRGRLDPQRLILSGIAVGFGCGALTLYVSLKMNPRDFEIAAVWLAGSIWSGNWRSVFAMLPWLALAVPPILRKTRMLDLLQLGEEGAKSVGVSTEREKGGLLLCGVCLIGACVSVAGSIGFVGLVAPHLAKRLAGVRHGRAVPLSGMLGMLLVTGADLIAKTAFAPVEVPVGLVTAIIGAPYFVYLLAASRRRPSG